MEWQPIETGPKDGTKVLIVYEAAAGLRVTQAQWNGNEYHRGWYCDVGFVPATHWMPMPPPPTK